MLGSEEIEAAVFWDLWELDTDDLWYLPPEGF